MNYNSPTDISNDFTKNAEQKAKLSLAKQVVYAILGGAFISLGGLLAITIAGGMPEISAVNPGITRFIFGAVFPVGLIMIVIGGAQLFTSDCAVLPYGFLSGKVSLSSVVRVWGIVYVSNFLGALMIAYFFSYQAEGLTAEPWKTFTINLGLAKTSASFLKVFIKAVGANWLVCMAVWMSYAAKDVTGKVIAIWVPVMCFVVLGLEHSIANMFFIPSAMLLGADISLYNFLMDNLVPATLGNIVGGALLVAGSYWYMFGNKVVDSRTNAFRSNHKTTLKDFENRLN
jgi:formate transporter